MSPGGGGITEKCTLHQFCVGHPACGVGQGQAVWQPMLPTLVKGQGVRTQGFSLSIQYFHLVNTNFSEVKH